MGKRQNRKTKAKLVSKDKKTMRLNRTKNEEDVLGDFLNKNKDCRSGNIIIPKFDKQHDALDWIYHNLPNLSYVIEQIVNFIFSNGLTTGDEEIDDKVLKPFLYAENINGITNYNVLRDAVRNMLVFGRSGIRWLSNEAGLIRIDERYFASLIVDDTEFYGFKKTIGYVMSTDQRCIEDINITEYNRLDIDLDTLEKKGIIYDDEKKLLFLSKEEFINLRNDTSKENGESKLLFDKQRVTLLIALYLRLIKDIEYDGTGRILVKVKNSYLTGEDNSVSTSEILEHSTIGKEGTENEIRKEIEGISRKIKNSSSDDVIALSDFFDEIIPLGRVMKSTELLNYRDDEGIIACQIYGIDPVLFGLGKVSGNISQEKKIDTAMLNGIVPYRENIAIQLSSVLAPLLGVEKIYFDKYELQQVNDDSDMINKYTLAAERLAKAGFATEAQGIVNRIMDIMKIDVSKIKIKIAEAKNKLLNFITGRKEDK